MKFRKSLFIVFLLTLLLLASTAVGSNNLVFSQSNPPIVLSQTVQNASNMGLDLFNAAINRLKDRLQQLEQELQQDEQYQSTIDLKNFSDEFKNLKSLAAKNQSSEIEKLARNEVLVALSRMESIQSNSLEPSDSIKTLQKTLKDAGEELSETGTYATQTNSALLNQLIKTSQNSLYSTSTLPSSTKESDGTVPDLTDENLKVLASAAAVGALLSLGANVWLFWQVHQLKQTKSSVDSTPSRSDKGPFEQLQKTVQNLSRQQAALAQQLNQKEQQRVIVEQHTPKPQVYGPREQQSSQSKYSEPPVISSGQASASADRDDYSGKNSPIYPARHGSIQSPSPAMSSDALIVQKYNANPAEIAATAEGVSETEDSIYRRRRDSSIKQVNLQKTSNYNYWIVADPDHQYWLVPKPDLKLNSMNFDTFQSLFNFQGQPSDSRFNLMKPAKVTYQANTGDWELVERGEVDFV